jgi:glycogen debranching enzyme
MDKMGSSERAGNRGESATPRDGAAVELQGLALRVARALDKYSKAGTFPYTVMKGQRVNVQSEYEFQIYLLGKNETWTWAEWATKIEKSFAQHFYVNEDSKEEFVNRRGIIKDSFGSSLKYTDFQLRPNFCIALDAVSLI